MPKGAVTCPNCGRDSGILEIGLFLDPVTDEIDGREYQCIDCSYKWDDRIGKPVQTGVEAYL